MLKMPAIHPNQTALSKAIGPGGKAVVRQKTIRVLQVFHGLGIGGAETWFIALLRYFHKYSRDLPLKLEFDVCLTGGQPEVFDAEAQSLGAKLFYIPFTRRNLVGFAREFRQLVARGKHMAIHDHQDFMAGFHFGIAAGYLPPVRLVHVHNPLLHLQQYLTGPLRKASVALCRRLVVHFATGILGTSNQVIRDYGYDQPPFAKLNRGAAHCGFDVSRFSGNYQPHHAAICRIFGWNEGVKIVLFVGRLGSIGNRKTTQKNPGFALDVARCCLGSGPNLRFLFAGHGEVGELVQEVRQWGLSAEIRFIGPRNDVPELMAGSDLLLFPSHQEGLGMVAVEAQASGLPVLASDTIPQEAVVIPDMVRFFSLSEGSFRWA